jgi:hypothetical protein
MQSDPIVDEVRRHRDEHAAAFNYDLDAICRDIQQRQDCSGRTYVKFPPKRPAGYVAPQKQTSDEQPSPELSS